MAGLRTEDVERSLALRLAEALGPSVPVHAAGALYDGKAEEWIEPRMVRTERGPASARGAENDMLSVAVACYSKRGRKGGKFGTLSAFADAVRAVVDSTTRAPAAKVRDERGVVVALLIFGTAAEARTFNATVSVEGVSYPGVDVATLTVRCVWTRTRDGYGESQTEA